MEPATTQTSPFHALAIKSGTFCPIPAIYSKIGANFFLRLSQFLYTATTTQATTAAIPRNATLISATLAVVISIFFPRLNSSFQEVAITAFHAIFAPANTEIAPACKVATVVV